MELSFAALKDKHRDIRDSWTRGSTENTNLRVHRGLSWLKSSEEANSDDMTFISLWISFNSLYGGQSTFSSASNSERDTYQSFFEKVVSLDKHDRLSSEIWGNYSNLFRHFINNKYVFKPFWLFQEGLMGEDEWLEKYDNCIIASKIALGNQDTARFLSILFDRLYLLRNQLMHGGATFESKINRDQLKLGRDTLAEIVPILIDILIENPEEDWGVPAYPPVEK